MTGTLRKTGHIIVVDDDEELRHMMTSYPGERRFQPS